MKEDDIVAFAAAQIYGIKRRRFEYVYHNDHLYLVGTDKDMLFVTKQTDAGFIKHYRRIVCTKPPLASILEKYNTTDFIVSRFSPEHLYIIGTDMLINGNLIQHEHLFYTPNKNELDTNRYVEIPDPTCNLSGWHGGRMANYISHNRLVLNQRYSTLVLDNFTNRILSKEPLNENSVRMVDVNFFNEHCTTASNAWRSALSRMAMKCPFLDGITQIVGPSEREDMQSLIRFMDIMAHKPHFYSTHPDCVKDKQGLIVFRYDKVYEERDEKDTAIDTG